MKLMPLFLIFSLVGCVSVVPVERTQVTDSQGELVVGCKNLADLTKVRRPSWQGYHTTWRSAWSEGMAAGIQEGLNGQGAAYDAVARALANPLPEEGDPVFRDGIIVGETPYCRAYAADRKKIAELVADIMPDLGNQIELSSIDAGIFLTKLELREASYAKWKDRYVITVTDERTNRTVVKVLRNVYISRQGSDFHQAESDGQKEAWILLQIEHALNPTYR